MRLPDFQWSPRRWSLMLIIGLIGVLLGGRLTLLTLRAQSDTISFGYDRGIQFVDPTGLNQVPFWTSQGATLNFTLYHLETTDFVKRAAHLQNNWWQPPPLLDVTGLPVTATWQQVTNNSWQMQTTHLPTDTVSAGLYIIEAKMDAGKLANMLLTVGRTVLTMKQGSGGQFTVWAAQLQTGEAVADLPVTLYDAQANPLAQATTDGSGIAHFTVSNGQPTMAVAQSAAEIAISGLDSQWQSGSCYWCWNQFAAAPYTIYAHTERPIYRPGDTIFYQAVVRNNLSTGYTPLAASEPISLTLRDVRNNVVATQASHADEFGAVAGQFKLGDEPPLGTYKLEVQVGGQIQSQSLQVEAYRKPEYEVKVSTPTEFAISGETLPVTVAADYYFGQPVPNAKVKLQIYRQPIYTYHYWWWYGYYPPYHADGLIKEVTGVTDNNGRWQIDFQPESFEGYDTTYSFKAQVTDARDLPVAGEKSLPVYWNNFDLAVRTDHYGYKSSEPVVVYLSAQNHDHTPVVNQPLTVRLVRDAWDWSNNRHTEVDVISPQATNTDASGKAQITLTALPQGWYRLVASSTDSRQRSVAAYNYLWIYNPNQNDWWFWNNEEVTVTADKEQYAPGDTATLLIQSRLRGPALLALERNTVQREMVIELNGPVTPVQIPITADLAPNVFAKVHIFKRTAPDAQFPNGEGSLVTGQTELVVPATAKQLQVQIQPDATTYQPGAQVNLTLRVTNFNDQPVRARVTLAVVDEAIFALATDSAGPIVDAFYGRQSYSGVLTYESLVRHPYYWSPVVDNVPAPTSTPDSAPIPSVTPGPTKSETPQVTPRRLFLDTAYWNPTLITDDQGMVTVHFTVPDNLTTWRIVAQAVTVATEVGEAQQKIVVSKAIIARPALPRFAVLGDRFRLGVVAQNFSGSDTSGSAALASDGLVVLNTGEQALNLPNRGTAVANWTVVAAQNTTTLVTTTLNTNNGQDSVELPLKIVPFAAPDRWSAAGQVNASTTLTFTVPFNAIDEGTNFTLRLAPSIALGLLDGLDELIDYPYGCVEQTMSRVLPSAVASLVYTDLGIANPKAEQLPEIMGQGLQKIYGFQHSDGSWGWFYDDAGGDYLTAYVLLGLQMIKQAGFAVNERVVTNGFAYLDRNHTVAEPRITAFVLYVKTLAGRGDLAQAQALVAQADQLDPAGLAALALTLQQGGDSGTAQTVLDRLLAQAQVVGNTAYWSPTQRQWQWYDWQAMSSAEKETAFALRAILAVRPNDPLLSKVVRWLMDQRNGAGWGGYGSANTQATAFAVLGLTDYIKQNNELQPNYHYRVLLNDAEVATGTVTPAQARQPLTPLTLPGGQLLIGDNTLRIERDNPDQGQLYFTGLLQQALFYDGFAPITSVDQGIALNRNYLLHEGTRRTDGAYNVGDVVEVALKVTVRERMTYVHISDPIPAGFEAIAERINPYRWGYCLDCYYPDLFDRREWGYNRKDLRDDRVDFFITDLQPGEHTLTYLMRATLPGEYSVLPGQAYPMYNDAIWGRSASEQVLVAPEELALRPTLAGDFDHNCRVTTFDTQLVAGAYGADNFRRNLLGDTTIDLADVNAVASRQGASCLSDQPAPGSGSGTARLALASTTQQIKVGETIQLKLTLADLQAATVAGATGEQLRGVGVYLHFDPNRLGVVKVRWNPALGHLLPLGPTVQESLGVVAFGAIDLPANLPADTPLATVTLIGRSVGKTQLTVTRAEALNSAGQLITAQTDGQPIVQVDGTTLYLATIQR